MRKEIKGILFIFVTFFIIIYYLISSEQLTYIVSAINKSNKFWLICALASISSYWLFESYIIQLILKEEKISLYNAVRLSMVGQFFSGLTPFATGGQPAQIITLNKMQVKTGVSTSALIGKFVVYQLTLVVYTMIFLLIKASLFVSHLNGMIMLVFIGFLINAAVITFFIAISFSKKINFKLSELIVLVLFKIKLVKNKEKVQLSLTTFINEFHFHMSEFRKNVKRFIALVALTTLQLTCYFSVPYFIYRSFGQNSVSAFTIIAAASFVLMLTSFIPLPGATGGAEGGFYMIFSLFFLSKFILPAILLWRLLTYYLWMGVGGIWIVLHRVRS